MVKRKAKNVATNKLSTQEARKLKTVTFYYTSILLLSILVSILIFSYSYSLLKYFVLFSSSAFLWKLNRFNGHVDTSCNTRYTLCIIEQSNENSNKSTSFVSEFVSSLRFVMKRLLIVAITIATAPTGIGQVSPTVLCPSLDYRPTTTRTYVTAIKSIVDSLLFWQTPSTFGPNVYYAR